MKTASPEASQPTKPLDQLSKLLGSTPKPKATPVFWHSDDFTEIRIGRHIHFLTRTQAAVLRYIHQEHLKGRVDVPGDRALKEAGSECTRMGEVFRYSSVWQTELISPFRRGYYALRPFISLK